MGRRAAGARRLLRRRDRVDSRPRPRDAAKRRLPRAVPASGPPRRALPPPAAGGDGPPPRSPAAGGAGREGGAGVPRRSRPAPRGRRASGPRATGGGARRSARVGNERPAPRSHRRPGRGGREHRRAQGRCAPGTRERRGRAGDAVRPPADAAHRAGLRRSRPPRRPDGVLLPGARRGAAPAGTPRGRFRGRGDGLAPWLAQPLVPFRPDPDGLRRLRRPRRPARPRAPPGPRRAARSPHPGLPGARGGGGRRAPPPRHRPLPRSRDPGGEGRDRRVPADRVRGGHDGLRARGTDRPRPALRRHGPASPAEQARGGGVGQAQEQGRRGRRGPRPRVARDRRRPAAEDPAARPPRVGVAARVRGLVPVSRYARPGRRNEGRARGPGGRPPDGPATVRRRGLRQDRSGPPGDLRGRDRRASGRRAGAHQGALRAARAHLHPAAGAVPRPRTAPLHPPRLPGEQAHAGRPGGRQRGRRRRDAPHAGKGRVVPGSRARRGGRGAALRREAEGTAEGDARRRWTSSRSPPRRSPGPSTWPCWASATSAT